MSVDSKMLSQRAKIDTTGAPHSWVETPPDTHVVLCYDCVDPRYLFQSDLPRELRFPDRRRFSPPRMREADKDSKEAESVIAASLNRSKLPSADMAPSSSDRAIPGTVCGAMWGWLACFGARCNHTVRFCGKIFVVFVLAEPVQGVLYIMFGNEGKTAVHGLRPKWCVYILLGKCSSHYNVV